MPPLHSIPCKTLFFCKFFTSPFFLAKEEIGKRLFLYLPLFPLLAKEGSEGWFILVAAMLRYAIWGKICSCRFMSSPKGDVVAAVLRNIIRQFS